MADGSADRLTRRSFLQRSGQAAGGLAALDLRLRCAVFGDVDIDWTNEHHEL